MLLGSSIWVAVKEFKPSLRGLHMGCRLTGMTATPEQQPSDGVGGISCPADVQRRRENSLP